MVPESKLELSSAELSLKKGLRKLKMINAILRDILKQLGTVLVNKKNVKGNGLVDLGVK